MWTFTKSTKNTLALGGMKMTNFVFTVLPFGLSTACYCFTKLMRPLVRFWRSRGLKAILYLDDGVLAVKGKEEALKESK